MRLLTASVALAIAVAGLPPCVGMDMSAGVRASHECCGAEPCPDQHAPTPHPTPAPGDDCCALGAPADSRSPIDRVASSMGLVLAPADSPVVFQAVVDVHVEAADTGPPPTPAVSRHVLFSQYLI